METTPPAVVKTGPFVMIPVSPGGVPQCVLHCHDMVEVAPDLWRCPWGRGG